MCYLVRQQQAIPDPAGAPLPRPDRGRQRWAGAALALGIAGVTLAGVLVAPPAAAPALDSATRAAAAPAPVAARAEIVPAAVSTAPRSLPADDDVPTVTGSSKAGYGGCSHGL